MVAPEKTIAMLNFSSLLDQLKKAKLLSEVQYDSLKESLKILYNN